jgi:hypothetical protein
VAPLRLRVTRRCVRKMRLSCAGAWLRLGLRRICGRLRRGVRRVREDRVSGWRSAYLCRLRRLSGRRRFAWGNRQLSHVAAAGGRPSRCRRFVLRSCSGQALCVDIIAETEEPVQGQERPTHRFCTTSPLPRPGGAGPALAEEERFRDRRLKAEKQRERIFTQRATETQRTQRSGESGGHNSHDDSACSLGVKPSARFCAGREWNVGQGGTA